MAETARIPRTSPLASGDALIAILAIVAIAVSMLLRAGGASVSAIRVPLLVVVAVGGLPLLMTLLRRVWARDFGSDLLAGLSIVTAVLLGEYLVAAVVVLMLSGGQALERYATQRAASVLAALARRNPSVAHRRDGTALADVPVDQIAPGDELVILPHEICPVDGEVRMGTSTMDESFLTGEPFRIAKTVGAAVVSGAVNGDAALTIVALRRAVDSRYERIAAIVRNAEEHRPPMRRLADRLGAWYTPLAVAIAAVGWVWSGQPSRFLAVLVIATPCPLLLGIPIALIGAISLAARRGIIIQDAAVLERLNGCRTALFDKTGTLTIGQPVVTDVFAVSPYTRLDVLSVTASLEQYSRHPLASAVLTAARAEGAPLEPVIELNERPGTGLGGVVRGARVQITGRAKLDGATRDGLPAEAGGLECVLLVADRVAGVIRFRDVPRPESASFIGHLASRHTFDRVVLVSGDRESEVRYLAETLRITHVHVQKSPEEKVAIVDEETRRQPSLFVGDGLNDAPAMLHATVGVALGTRHEVTSGAAGAVILDGTLAKVDELMHIARRTRRIALQTAIGGMALSLIGMGLAVSGWLVPLTGAVLQEIIDVAAVLNALRASRPPRLLTDYQDHA